MAVVKKSVVIMITKSYLCEKYWLWIINKY